MAKPKPIHTVPYGDGWANIREGGQRHTDISPTQAGSAAAGRDRARAEGGRHLLHGRDNLIRDERTYGKDPFPPKG